jgi:CubicO group peptidase (beta-lactamase class C family)
MKTLRRLTLAALFLIFVTSIAGAQVIPQATTPEEVGLSKERLQRISAWLQTDVDKKVIPGAVVMVLRKGKVAYYEAFGYQDREKNIPMSRISIFRIASMTKPFTSLATMMLAEEGKIQILLPVSRYLPEFKDLKVGVEKKDEATGKAELVFETPSRPMTVQDLLRHTSGLTYAFIGKSMVKDLYNKANLWGSKTTAELVTKLSQLPLQYHPGTTWDYSHSTDVLARIVEVISGVEFDTFVEERIAKPLKLADTTFWVEGAERQTRIAEPQIDPKTGKRPPWIPDMTKRPNFMSGGSGLVSTAYDYARFCLMLYNGGVLDGTRLVSRKTVEHMTSNHIPPGYKYSTSIETQLYWPSPSMETGQAFGLGFAIDCESERSPLPGSKGLYYWNGIYGTHFWIDPKEQIIAILMMQEPNIQNFPYTYRMRHFVYQAIVD